MPDITFNDLSENDINLLKKLVSMLERRMNLNNKKQTVIVYDSRSNSFQIFDPIITVKMTSMRQTVSVETAVFVTVKLDDKNFSDTEYHVYICDKGDLENVYKRDEYFLKEKIIVYSSDIKVRIYKEDEERKNKQKWDDDKCFIEITYPGDENDVVITYEYINEPRWVRI